LSIDDGDRDEFSVTVFFDDDTHVYIGRWMSAKNSVELAKAATNRAAVLPSVVKVIITDGGDHTVFQWERDKGVTFK
jgi:hypothetical protein